VRNRVAPTPTGSKTQGLLSSFARVAATCEPNQLPPPLIQPKQQISEEIKTSTNHVFGHCIRLHGTYMKMLAVYQ
jgi:hypothetical protein